MRRLLVLTAVVVCTCGLHGLLARADGQTASCPKIVVHVTKPEVVVEDADEACKPGKGADDKRCFLFHRHRQPAAPPPHAIATILAPTAAVVPAPTTAVVPHTSFVQGAPDDHAMRAACDLEMALSTLNAARAAQKARLEATDAAVLRVTNAVQATQRPSSAITGPQGDKQQPVTLETLAQNLKSLNERVDALDLLVRQQQKLLQQKYPDSFK